MPAAAKGQGLLIIGIGPGKSVRDALATPPTHPATSFRGNGRISGSSGNTPRIPRLPSEGHRRLITAALFRHYIIPQDADTADFHFDGVAGEHIAVSPLRSHQ